MQLVAVVERERGLLPPENNLEVVSLSPSVKYPYRVFYDFQKYKF